MNRTTVPPRFPGRLEGLREPLAMVSQTTQSGKHGPCGWHWSVISGVKRMTLMVEVSGVARCMDDGARQKQAGYRRVKAVMGQV
jgi:hypothetical protein